MQPTHCSVYEFFCLKIKTKNRADSYMPCEAMAHSTKLQLITKYEDPKTKKKSYQCIASDCGETRAGNATFDRVLKHATACKHLEKFSPKAYHDTLAQLGQSSLGAQLDETSQCLPHGQTGLDMVPIHDQGKKIKEDARQLFQAKVDHIIMRLICVHGLIPNLIDSAEWKELMHVLNGN